MADLSGAIRDIACMAMQASNPASVSYGVITKESPLTILVDQKFSIIEKAIVLTRNVTDFETEVTVEWMTEDDNSIQSAHSHQTAEGAASTEEFDTTHAHELKGRKKIIVHNALKTGDKVILLQAPGGQKYIVLDRLPQERKEDAP